MRKATVTSGGEPSLARPTLGGETRIAVVRFNIHADLGLRADQWFGMTVLWITAKSRLHIISIVIDVTA